MDKAVEHSNTDAGVPLYYKSGLLFNNMAVDAVSVNGTMYNVFFLSTGNIEEIISIFFSVIGSDVLPHSP